jgi:molybdenum cofactor cytidylyltransferase
MFSSILCGIVGLPDSADGALMVLADQPQIDAAVVRGVAKAYREGEKGIVIPTFGGKRGHPALVDLRRYRAEITGLSGEAGLKPVMRGHPEDTLELPVDDGRILRDIDTPEDYRTELERKR